jgi:NADP-dependent 3-hydroxy acid dehydrogenase YdfG
MTFPYKCVLVTGATSGIGLALAEKIIAHGSFVIAVGRRQDRLDELVRKHGEDKVAAECFDVGQIEKLPEWTTR